MYDMDRDDRLLRAIAEGATSSAALAERTGLSPASVWRGLHRLSGSGYVFSPTRGVYRLTAVGARVLAPSGAPDPSSDPAVQESPAGTFVAARAPALPAQEDSAPTIAPQPEPKRTPPPGDGAPAENGARMPDWLRWSGLVALGVGVVAFLYAVAQPPAPAPPPAVPPQPVGWPYNGQRWDW